MNYSIEQTDEYGRRLKRLVKKHRSLRKDLSDLYDTLERDPFQGVLIRPHVRKLRVAITSKGRGKSGGARVLTYLVIPKQDDDDEGKIYLLTIYDKGDIAALTDDYIDDLINEIDIE